MLAIVPIPDPDRGASAGLWWRNRNALGHGHRDDLHDEAADHEHSTEDHEDEMLHYAHSPSLGALLISGKKSNESCFVMPTPLHGCILKIDRAKEHRDALEKYERETFAVESNRPRLGIKFEPDTEDYVLFVNYMPDLDLFLDRYCLILGDAVHNLIAALDRLAYQLALLHTGGNIQKPNSIQFPICDTTDAFEMAKGRRLSEISPDHVAIMERFQGYHRVDERHVIGSYFHPLSKLRDLASVDKHRLPIDLVIPTSGIQSPTSANVVAIFTTGVMERVLGAGSYKPRAAKLGAEVERSKVPGPAAKAEMDMAGYISPNVAIDREYGAVGAFDKIAAVVLNVVREFEPVF